MSEPLVSVIMPTYRRPAYLREALTSAVNQTYRNLQIIVRDNASGDDTPAVVASFHDPRIEFLQAGRTGSALENGAECFRRVRGEYFFPLCDDDRAGPNYIETLVTELERDKSVLIAYGATTVIDETGKVIEELVPDGTYRMGAAEIIRAWCTSTIPLASGINLVCPTWLIRYRLEDRAFVNGHHTDNALFITAGLQGKALFTDKCTFYYRRHATNTEKLSSYQDRLKGDEQLLAYLETEVHADSNKSLPLAEWPPLREQLRSMLAGRYYDLLRRYHLGQETGIDLWRAVFQGASGVYGWRNGAKFLRREFSIWLSQIQDKAKRRITRIYRRRLA